MPARTCTRPRARPPQVLLPGRLVEQAFAASPLPLVQALVRQLGSFFLLASLCTSCLQASNPRLLIICWRRDECGRARPRLSMPPLLLPAPSARWHQPPPALLHSSRMQPCICDWAVTRTSACFWA